VKVRNLLKGALRGGNISAKQKRGLGQKRGVSFERIKRDASWNLKVPKCTKTKIQKGTERMPVFKEINAKFCHMVGPCEGMGAQAEVIRKLHW